MKSGQLIEYNTRNNCLKNHAKNVVEILVSDSFFKKWKLSVSLDQQSEFSYSVFLLYVQVEDYQSKLKLVLTISFYFIQNVFKKTNRGLELVSLPHFLYDFWKKALLTLYSINWPNFIVWLPLLFEISGNIFTVTVCYPVWNAINFEFFPSLLIKPFFHIIKKSGQKCEYLKNENSF